MLHNGLLILKIFDIDLTYHNLIGFYFSPNNSYPKCLLLEPTASTYPILPLSEILSNGSFSEILYRELINDNDITCFKLALVNMQSSFHIKFCNSWVDYCNAHIDYISKTIGQNISERIHQGLKNSHTAFLPQTKSYDPFAPPKVCIRDHIIDKNHIERLSWLNVINKMNNSLSTSDIVPSDILIKNFLINMIDNGTAANDSIPMKLPLSLRVPTNHIFYDSHITTKWGCNIYDASCWEIALWLLQDQHNLDNIRLCRKTTQFSSIMGNNINSRKSYRYLDSDRRFIYPYDPEGLAFDTISNYYSYNPITHHPQQWNSESQYWSKFSSSLGPNTWFFIIAPFIRNSSNKEWRPHRGCISVLDNLQHIDGGFYHSPLSNTEPNLSISIQDNISLYSGLSHMLAFEHFEKISFMMNHVIRLFSSLIDKDKYFFYSGKVFENDKWVIDTEISVIVQIWAICSLQPKLIDELFQTPKATLKMWHNLKEKYGVYHCRFVGFSSSNNIITSEINFSAMMACKILQEYYGETMPELTDMEWYMYQSNTNNIGDDHLLHINDNEAYFHQSNINDKDNNSLPSILATAWHVFYSKSWNPFVPNGSLLR